MPAAIRTRLVSLLLVQQLNKLPTLEFAPSPGLKLEPSEPMILNGTLLGGAVPPAPSLHVETVNEPANEPVPNAIIQNATDFSIEDLPPCARNLPLYRKIFDDSMENKPVKHDEAFVLLLSWDDAENDIKVKPEFDELEHFLDKEYGFKVQRKQIGIEKPAHQLNSFLSNFMLENDDEDRLLIVYYGGHGIYQNKPGDQYNGIQWHASASHTRKDQLVWSKAEHCITQSKGDVLVIFDCSYAGSFGGKKVRAARPRFEFIAACGAREVTALPGGMSFTTAFMWALECFKKQQKCPFTSRQLIDKLKTRLKTQGQTPELQVLDRQAGGIWICPQNLPAPFERQVFRGEHRRAHHEFIDLRLNFYRRLEPDDAANVAKHLSCLVREVDDFAKEITLINVSNPAAEYVENWREFVKRKRSASQSSMQDAAISESTDHISSATLVSADVEMNEIYHEVESSPGAPPQKRLNQRRHESEGILSKTSGSRDSTPRSTEHDTGQDDGDFPETDLQSSDEIIVINDWGDSLRVNQQHHRLGLELMDAPRKEPADLKSQLAAARALNISGQSFIPINTIEALMTEGNVRHELSKHKTKLSEEMEEEVLDAVCTPNSMNRSPHDNSIKTHGISMQRLFAILVLLGKPDEILRFKRAGIADSDLPFTKVGSSQLARRGGQLLSELSDWTTETADNLIHHQIEVTVPYFPTSSQALHYSFENSVVLPFESKGALSRGSRGQVYQVKIHPGHHGFSQMTKDSGNIAVKQLGAAEKKDFEHEAKILRRISGQHDHLVNLLATYRLGNSFHLIFPWANGDLRSFWEQNREPEKVASNISKWIASQCLGLAQALALVHNYRSSDKTHLYYRHGDLKPENILWFDGSEGSDIGTLKIAHWGIAKAHSTYEGQPREVRCTPTYRAPENDLSNLTSPKYDIWSLGCIFLEFAIWFLLGWDAVEYTFPTARTTALSISNDSSKDDSFFYVQSDGHAGVQQASIKDSVIQWLHMLHQQPRCTRFFHDLLYIVEEDMLVVDEQNRTNADDLVSKLKTLAERGQSDSTYWLRSNQQYRSRIIDQKLFIANEGNERLSAAVPSSSPRRGALLRDMVLAKRARTNKNQRKESERFTGVKSTERFLSSSQRRDRRFLESRLATPPKRTFNPTRKLQPPQTKSRISNEQPALDGIQNLRLVEHDAHVDSMTTLDKLRMRIEQYISHEMNWHPLPPINRLQSPLQAKLVWEYGDQEMSIILNQEESERYRNKLPNQSQDILPVSQPNLPSTSTTPIRGILNSTWSFAQRVARGGISICTQRTDRKYPAAIQSKLHPDDESRKESYLCIDKCWTSIKETNMSTISSIETMSSDAQFFCQAQKILSQAQGGWIQRFLSWRSYTQICLSKFYFLFDNTDLVELDLNAMSKSNPPDICPGYEYTCTQPLDIDTHMRIMAQMILHGIQNPQLGHSSRTVLSGIPKLKAPPGLAKKALSAGWGFHAEQGLCLKKIVGWIGSVVAFGVAFVPAWLCGVSKVDLQNAFAPVTFLGTLVGIGLALAAIGRSL